MKNTLLRLLPLIAFAFVGPDNASISKLVVTSDRWIIRGYNDTAHLGG